MQHLFTPLPHALLEFRFSLHRFFCTHHSFHKLSRVPKRVQLRELYPERKPMAGKYKAWTQEQLIARIQQLEEQIGNKKTTSTNISEPNSAIFTSFPIPSPINEPKPLAVRKAPRPPPKAFNASKYSTRLIALKFAYLGQKYNGFEHHNNNSTPLPTIEEEIWKALVKTRLIDPTPVKGVETDYSRVDKKTFAAWDREGIDVNWEGCEYSKCGRTDRGVSAFGQVIGVRVRSSRPLPKLESLKEGINQEGEEGDTFPVATHSEPETTKTFNDVIDELPYIQLLNRVLPPDIRIYAWCPNPPADFSARFSCKERRYKYFFSNPSFAPVPGSLGLYNAATSSAGRDTMRESWLDIEAMEEGCRQLLGLHDFRNFCKIDASKQLSNFKRRIFHADIEEVSPLSVPTFLSNSDLSSPTSSSSQPKMYAFTLHGSAFLWHQVRSIVAILFLIGQRLEAPSLVPQLLDVETNPTRPKYEMASDAPLVLWDCIFPAAEEVQSSEEREHGYEDRLEWIFVGDEGGMEPKSFGKGKRGQPSTMSRGKWGRGGVIDDLWEVWRGNKIDETLSALLLDKIAAQGKSTWGQEVSNERTIGIPKGGPRVFDGGNFGRAKGTYVPVMQRERQEPVEVVNERYAKRKGLDMNRVKAKAEDADE